MALKGISPPKIDTFAFPENRTKTKMSVKPYFTDISTLNGILHRQFKKDSNGLQLFSLVYTVIFENCTIEEYASIYAFDDGELHQFLPHSDGEASYYSTIIVSEYNKNDKFRINSLKILVYTRVIDDSYIIDVGAVGMAELIVGALPVEMGVVGIDELIVE